MLSPNKTACEQYIERLPVAFAVGLLTGFCGALNQYVVGNAVAWCLDQVAPNWGYTDKLTIFTAGAELEIAMTLAGFLSYGCVYSAIFLFRQGNAMNLLRAYFILGLTGLIGGALGGIIGMLLGVCAPDYYRGVFRAHDVPGFDPLQVGLGLGVSQGIPLGLAAGAVVLIVMTWYNSRKPAGIAAAGELE
jgi:hypothetical protein